MFNPSDLHFSLCFSDTQRPAKRIYPLNYPTTFCELIRASETGYNRCIKSDKRAFRISCEIKRPLIYECHAGIVDGVIPIMLGDSPVAFLMFGQFLMETPTEEKFQEIWEKIKDLPLDYRKVREAFLRLPVLPSEYVESVAEGLFQVIQGIVREISPPFLPMGEQQGDKTDLELWIAQQEWQILRILKEERALLSLFRWASNKAVLENWRQIFTKELQSFEKAPWEAKSRIWGIITSLLSHIRIFKASSQIDLLELSLHYGRMIKRCDTVSELQEILEWIMNDLLSIRREPSFRDSVIERAKTYILQNYSNEHLGLNEIARAMRLSPPYLARLFKKVVGMSVGRYIREVRVSRAKELLETTNLSIIEVALEVGYSDHSHFTKIFRKETGLSPSEYRKKAILG
jgi:two-component system response regulator YesN